MVLPFHRGGTLFSSIIFLGLFYLCSHLSASLCYNSVINGQ